MALETVLAHASNSTAGLHIDTHITRLKQKYTDLTFCFMCPHVWIAEDWVSPGKCRNCNVGTSWMYCWKIKTTRRENPNNIMNLSLLTVERMQRIFWIMLRLTALHKVINVVPKSWHFYNQHQLKDIW